MQEKLDILKESEKSFIKNDIAFKLRILHNSLSIIIKLTLYQCGQLYNKKLKDKIYMKILILQFTNS